MKACVTSHPSPLRLEPSQKWRTSTSPPRLSRPEAGRLLPALARLPAPSAAPLRRPAVGSRGVPVMFPWVHLACQVWARELAAGAAVFGEYPPPPNVSGQRLEMHGKVGKACLDASHSTLGRGPQSYYPFKRSYILRSADASKKRK